ncbi:hypothetical protein [Burkholderia gladioli]|uniref:hypothetical protein n=1 Tax=Burkholderia gladioli TaxID=28095 RepID=UPI001FC8459A|nr:hypothetical protein [Burkholderia gladioli]
MDAIGAYLNRYTHSPNTLRGYRCELERLLLWCVVERGTALSSMWVEDCEASKADLVSPAAAFCGPRVERGSPRWRPFSDTPLSLESQRYAVRTIRAAFDWLVRVRYLAGNPWAAVPDPRPVKRLALMRIERALPLDLWTGVRIEVTSWSESLAPDAARWRVARALLHQAAGALLAPLVVPLTPRAEAKFGTEPGSAAPAGYSVRGAAGVLAWLLGRLQATMTDLSEPERRQLALTALAAPHVRHSGGGRRHGHGRGTATARPRLASNDLGVCDGRAAPAAHRGGEIPRCSCSETLGVLGRCQNSDNKAR